MHQVTGASDLHVFSESVRRIGIVGGAYMHDARIREITLEHRILEVAWRYSRCRLASSWSATRPRLLVLLTTANTHQQQQQTKERKPGSSKKPGRTCSRKIT